MILRFIIIIIIILIFYLVINYNIDYFIDKNNSRNSNEYPWDRNDINSIIPIDIKMKNNKSNLYEYGNEEYERKLKEIFDVSLNNSITIIESNEWSNWIKPNVLIKQYYNNIYKFIYNKINNSDLLVLPEKLNNDIMIQNDKLIRIKKNKEDYSYYMFDIEMVLYRNNKPLGKHCKFIVVSNNVEINVIFVKIIGVINEAELMQTNIQAYNESNNYDKFIPNKFIKISKPNMNSYIYEGNDKLLNSEIEYNIYNKLLNTPDICNIKLEDQDKIISMSNEEYKNNMISVRNYFLSKLK